MTDGGYTIGEWECFIRGIVERREAQQIRGELEILALRSQYKGPMTRESAHEEAKFKDHVVPWRAHRHSPRRKAIVRCGNEESEVGNRELGF